MGTPEQQAINQAIEADPTTPSPYPVQEGVCGHCGSHDTEPQWWDVQCRQCGKYSHLDGTPIQGCPRHIANAAVSAPWVNDYLKNHG